MPQYAFKMSMFNVSAIHINSRSWLRSSSTHEPSDPPLRIVSFIVDLLKGLLGFDRSEYMMGLSAARDSALFNSSQSRTLYNAQGLRLERVPPQLPQ